MSQPDGTSPTTDFSQGDPAAPAPNDGRRPMEGLTLGDFRIGRPLGKGGMGEVYAAHQISLNREVALKVLRKDLLTNPTYLARFEAEAHAAAKLNHPHIVHIYALGNVEGIRFIAMEYVAGTNLREYLLRKGPPDLALALSIMRQSGAAVGAAGEVGLVHRDIKPENLLLTKKGQVKVADFGLSRNLDDDTHHVTQPGVTMGTPLYMSPEQARGRALDHRSDLYSLGVTFYHMLSGSPPFRAETALALAMKHVSDTPIDLSVHRPDLPIDLTRLVMKLMAKSPDHRYQSAAEMLRDLTRIRETIAVASMTNIPATPGTGSNPSVPITNPAPAAEAPGPAAEAPPRPPFRLPIARPGKKALALASALGLLAGAGAGWLARPRDLLSAKAGTQGPAHPAGWLAPGWRDVPRRGNALAQYRHAQLLPTAGERMPAWVAVPGFFPNDESLAYRSYGQVARELFRARDRDRLVGLAAILDNLPARSRGQAQALARVMRLGVLALDGDAEKVLGELSAGGPGGLGGLDDPGLADFALEIVLRLGRDEARLKLSPAASARLRDARDRLARHLVELRKKDAQG
ncbi:serine/threonine-protein kinase [Tundrisphaera sp. TA3]|uniref:serine/threonine-protein kinase n=1 Tax=Tundrisphaera sp. TA3 TaxID=3435775 RepID=UPI003EBE1B27